MKKTTNLTLLSLLAFLITSPCFSQIDSPDIQNSNVSNYAEDEAIIIFDSNASPQEINAILTDYNMEIIDGPSLYVEAYLIRFIDGEPPYWAYQNPIDPINGVIEKGHTTADVNGIGLNYSIYDPVQQVGERFGSSSSNAGCKRIMDNVEHGLNSTKIGIFDTGISELQEFQDFFNFGNLGYNYLQIYADPIDDNNHGTHVSSIAIEDLESGIYEFKAYKTHNQNGSGRIYDVIKGIGDAIYNDTKIVNFSFSFIAGFNHRNDAKAPLSIAIDIAGNMTSMLCIAAAGNENNNSDNNRGQSNYPASYLNDNIISVASVNCHHEKSPWSNYGHKSVDIAAPGELISGLNRFGNYVEMSGTSQATPYVTKVAALLATYQSSFDFEETKCAILNGSINLQTNQFNTHFVKSNGFISSNGALNALLSGSPCTYTNPINRIEITDQKVDKLIYRSNNEFEILASKDQKSSVLITNIMGQIVLQENILLYEGQDIYNLNISPTQNPSIHFVSIIIDDEIITKKIVF